MKTKSEIIWSSKVSQFFKEKRMKKSLSVSLWSFYWPLSCRLVPYEMYPLNVLFVFYKLHNLNLGCKNWFLFWFFPPWSDFWWRSSASNSRICVLNGLKMFPGQVFLFVVIIKRRSVASLLRGSPRRGQASSVRAHVGRSGSSDWPTMSTRRRIPSVYKMP